MRSGKVERATTLAGKIGNAIKNYNRAELSRVDVLVDPRNMWAKMRQLTGCTKSIDIQVTNLGIIADILNDYIIYMLPFTVIPVYVAPKVKLPANNSVNLELIMEWRICSKYLTLYIRSGQDSFLRVGAPFFWLLQ